MICAALLVKVGIPLENEKLLKTKNSHKRVQTSNKCHVKGKFVSERIFL